MPKSTNKKKDDKKKGNENEDKNVKDKSKKNGKGGHANDNDKELKTQESLVTDTPEISPEELERIEREKQLEEQRQKELEEERRKAEEMIIQITPEDLINERIKTLPLDIQLLRYGLSNPGLAPDGKSMVYLKLSLENIGLSDISILHNYKYIQQLELSGNSISDTTVLGNMRYLIKLDLSNNNITHLLDFEPHPFNLQEIDFSRNKIEKINNLSSNRFLKKICLEKNLIHVIEGLENCKYLTHLSLSHNFISKIENLHNLPLVYLDLSYNNITKIQGISSLEKLHYFDISHNRLSSLCGLQNSLYLNTLNVSFNEIVDLEEIKYIMDLPFLTDFFMHNNAAELNEKDFRLKVIYNLPTLEILDGVLINEIEKIRSLNTFQPPDFVVDSINQINGFYKSLQLNTNLHSLDKLFINNICLIILCSNPSCGKQKYIHKLIKEHPNVCGTPIVYTTDQDLCKDIDSNYHYVGVNTMKDMIQENKFIQITGSSGKYFGITYESVQEIKQSGRICIISLNIEGVKNISTSNMNYVILFITRQENSILSNNSSSVMVNSNSNEASSTYITDSTDTSSGSNPNLSSDSGSGSGSGTGSGSDPSSLASSKDYTYSTTFTDSLDPSFSFDISDNTTSSSNFYSLNSSDYTHEGVNDPKSHSTYSNSNNNNYNEITSQNFFDPSSSTTFSSSSITNHPNDSNSSGGDGGGEGYQAETSSSSDGCIYYNLSSSTNPDDTDASNILSSVMTESLFLNSSDNYPNIENQENYFNHLIKPIRILDSKCSSRKGQRPSKFEPHNFESFNCLEKPPKYNRIENFFITELQEWLSNSRIGTDLSSDIFNYIILNENFDSTYHKLEKWIVSLYWSAYDAQEIDKRVKEMKLLEEEMNYLKS